MTEILLSLNWFASAVIARSLLPQGSPRRPLWLLNVCLAGLAVGYFILRGVRQCP